MAASLRGIEAFLGNRTGQASAKRLRDREDWTALRGEVERMMRSGEWDEAEPRHFAGLHAVLFEKVYGVQCSEMQGPGRFQAAKMAAQLLVDQFAEDPARLVHYVRWAWEREAGREKWRRDNARDGGSMSFRWVLQEGRTLDDYRIFAARKASR
jgi:hypothetical protein